MSKRFTDLFITRPVLSSVVSLFIFILGLCAIFELPVRQYPKMENTVITITTAYPGANASLVQGFITTPIEKKLSSAGGIDYMTSQSTDGLSTITANILLNYDPNVAFTNIMSKVAQAKYELPHESEDPVITKATGDTFALMYLSFSSPYMTAEQITDYITRVVQPKIETVNGVSEVDILGGNEFAMRIWLDPSRMAALGVSPTDVKNALLANNIQTAAGSTKGKYISITINAKTDLQTQAGFENLIIKQDKGQLVRLRDVATVQLGSSTYNSSVYFNGKKATFMSVNALPDANPLTVISDVKKLLPALEKNFPPSLHSAVVFDATTFIHASLVEVIRTIFEAALIVIAIIYLFLGSLRSVCIPVITIPLSLVGVFGLMLAMGYSINLLTLLALVLAIGMVVDDAIVVVENIHRHIEEGLTPLDAALTGAREIAFPVVVMTLTLAAVYAPIGFMGGITGALFKEFAFTLAGAVVLSGVIALTLSPMMCAHLLTVSELHKPMAHYVDEKFNAIKRHYQAFLNVVLGQQKWMLFFAGFVLLSCFLLFATTKKELAPQEDQGIVWVMGQGPQSGNIDYTEAFTSQLNGVYAKYRDLMEDYFVINGWGSENAMGSGFLMKPWDDRSMSSITLANKLNGDLSNIAGLQLQAVAPPALPGGGLFPISFVVNSVQPLSEVYPLARALMEKAMKSGLFMFLFTDVKYDKPQVTIDINREKAAQMGITMQSISDALATALGGNYVNRFAMQGYAYQVIPQLDRQFRLNPDNLKHIYLSATSGLVPLSTIATLNYTTNPNQMMRFQQLNAVTIQGMPMPGTSMAQGLAYLQNQANQSFPVGVTYDYAGSSRQYMHEGNALMMAFLFSIIFIFLVLAAQFESFRDPLVVMVSVPMAICGALLPLNWGLASINIYTEVGLITLVGLISKHGILMVDFANQLRVTQEIDRMEAIMRSAAIRLRPILMTTAAMILGVLPLLIATGAGAVSRFDIGLVIASGMMIGTLFTLFVVPVMYVLTPREILKFLGIVLGVIGLLYLLLIIL